MIRPEYADAVVRVHRPSGPMLLAQTDEASPRGSFPADAASQPISIITAHNPGGQPFLTSENRAFQSRLLKRLAQEGVTYWPAALGDQHWSHMEESVAIAGIDPTRACEIGREFGQDAIFVWGPNDWRIMSCTDGTTLRRSWAVLANPPRFEAVDRAYRALGLSSPFVPLLVVHAAVDKLIVDATAEGAAQLELYAGQLDAEYHRVNVAADERVRQERPRLYAEQADREKKLAAAEHRRHIRAGWPRTWRPAAVAEWSNLGGTATQAAAFADASWPVDDVLAAARRAGSATTLAVPTGDAELHYEFGDDPVGVIAGTLPAIPSGTTLVVKRANVDGRMERWHVADCAPGVAVTRTISATDRPWSSRRFGTWPTIEDAFEGVRGLRRVPKDAATEIVAPEADWLDLIPLLDAPAGGLGDPESWPPGVTEVWLSEDEYLAATLQQPLSGMVRLRINGTRPIPWRGSRPARWLTIDLDDDEWSAWGDLPGEIARCTWVSDSGGAPISWDGGNSLNVVEPDLVADRQWGDNGRELKLLPWPTAVAARAALISDWVQRLELDTVAAIMLEPWPSGAELHGWDDVTIWFTLNVDDEVTKAVRRRLARRSSLYCTTRDAVQHPNSVNGHRLRATIRESRNGFTGWVYGSWLNADT